MSAHRMKRQVMLKMSALIIIRRSAVSSPGPPLTVALE